MPQLKKQTKLYLGIDPGASGGVALVGDTAPILYPMPKTENDVWGLISAMKDLGSTFAYIEKVGGYIGGVGHPGSAMFNFGKGYGGLRMALIAARIPFEEIPPQTWQKRMGVTPRKKKSKNSAGESKSQFKNRLKARAQQLFPHVNITLATADAILIAEFCRRSNTNG